MSTERAYPAPIVLTHGTLVRLRPLRREDLPLYNQWENDPAVGGHSNLFSFHTMSEHEREFIENGFIGREGGLLIVETLAEESAIGVVGYQGLRLPERCAEFGCHLEPNARSKGYGTEAQQLLINYLFGHLGVHRVEAQTAASNVAELAALRKIGLVEEGVRRAAFFAHGVWLDMVLLSMLESEWLSGRSGRIG